MSRYEATLDVLARRKIPVGGSLTLSAAALNKTRKGQAYVMQGVGGALDLIAGIAADGEFLPMSSDAAPKARLTLAAPETEQQKAALADAVLAYIKQQPNCGGSQYDPTCAPAWAHYRADLAALRP